MNTIESLQNYYDTCYAPNNKAKIADIIEIMKPYEFDNSLFARNLNEVCKAFMSLRRHITQIDLCYLNIVSDMLEAMVLNARIHSSSKCGIYSIIEKQWNEELTDTLERIFGTSYKVVNNITIRNETWSYDESFSSNLSFINYYYPIAMDWFLFVMGEIATYSI